MKEIHCFIFGRVQGVGYRAWCEKEARKLSLSGWVRNRSNGSVEVYAKGSVENIDVFLVSCKNGPLFAYVKSIEPVSIVTASLPLVEEGIFKQMPTM